MNSGFGTRIVGTVIIGVGWLVFFILYLAFDAGNFTIWQNLAVFLASMLIAGGLMAIMWIAWALRW
jgi:hypothetical protein